MADRNDQTEEAGEPHEHDAAAWATHREAHPPILPRRKWLVRSTALLKAHISQCTLLEMRADRNGKKAVGIV